jgi:hypothetical protein
METARVLLVAPGFPAYVLNCCLRSNSALLDYPIRFYRRAPHFCFAVSVVPAKADVVNNVNNGVNANSDRWVADPMVAGSIGSQAPEPSTIFLMLLAGAALGIRTLVARRA